MEISLLWVNSCADWVLYSLRATDRIEGKHLLQNMTDGDLYYIIWNLAISEDSGVDMGGSERIMRRKN